MSSTQQLLLGEGAGGGAVATYIEDVFSTYLYAGNGSGQTITNGIDLATKGGLVWIKSRGQNTSHVLVDSARGAPFLESNSTQPQNGNITMVDSLNTNGFGVTSSAIVNGSGYNYASWTFREQPKFFDVVTYTGNASARTIAHNLGSVPGCIMVKCTSEATDWWVYHRSLGTNQVIKLNTTAAQDTSATAWNNTAPTSTVFSIGDNGQVNSNGQTYVAYLFAHNAGGFGLTGTDNVISCGSFTTDGSGAYSVTLGYEPQFVLMKRTDSTGDWLLMDNMRGMPVGGNDAILRPNTSGAETQTFDCANPSATGFYESTGSLGLNRTFIYIAIRRGPMKVPTSGTSVFEPVTYTGTGADITVSSSNVVDLAITMARTSGGFSAWDKLASTRLTGNTFLSTNLTDAEASGGNVKVWNATQDSITLNQSYASFATNFTYVTELFKRAPSFFDVVCYTGVGGQTLNHNLGVTPELIISKRRSGAYDWTVYSSERGTSNTLFLNLGTAETAYTSVSAATSTTFTVQGVADAGGERFVAYLFATCAGVSKVGSYAGTGTTLQVNCGFTGGARFVMIKRASGSGSWYVWDSARGITSGNDPYLRLNSTDPEVTNENLVDTYSAGFQLNTGTAVLNASGSTYIFLAIA